MKILVISQPKSGTYLCVNVLQNLGLDFTYMHISQTLYDKYDPDNLEDGKKNPEKYRHTSDLKNSLSLIDDGQFAVSHLDYTLNTERLLSDFKKIVLYRNPEEAAVSWNRWKHESGRNMRTQKKIDNKNILKWSNKNNTFTLLFDDMVNKNNNRLDALQTFLFDDILYDSEEIIQKSLSQNSLTKSTIRC